MLYSTCLILQCTPCTFLQELACLRNYLLTGWLVSKWLCLSHICSQWTGSWGGRSCLAKLVTLFQNCMPLKTVFACLSSGWISLTRSCMCMKCWEQSCWVTSMINWADCWLMRSSPRHGRWVRQTRTVHKQGDNVNRSFRLSVSSPRPAHRSFALRLPVHRGDNRCELLRRHSRPNRTHPSNQHQQHPVSGHGYVHNR